MFLRLTQVFLRLATGGPKLEQGSERGGFLLLPGRQKDTE